MAKTKRIVVTIERKVSDDNYGSYGTSVTEEVELEAGDDLKEERRAARNRVLVEVRNTLKALKEALPTKTKKTKD